MKCAMCLCLAQGNYSIHRDGLGVGPELPLCDACGGSEGPSCEEMWAAFAKIPSYDDGANPDSIVEQLRMKGLDPDLRVVVKDGLRTIALTFPRPLTVDEETELGEWAWHHLSMTDVERCVGDRVLVKMIGDRLHTVLRYQVVVPYEFGRRACELLELGAGCSNGGCDLYGPGRKPGGVHTNGMCHCLDDLHGARRSYAERRALRAAVAATAKSLASEVA